LNPPSVPFNPVCADLLARLDRVPGFSLFVNERAALLLVPSELVGVIAGNAAADAMIRAGLSAATIARLDLLASGLAPMSGVRLERLELPSAGGPVVLTAACRRIRDDDGRMVLVVAAQGPSAAAMPATAVSPVPESGPAIGTERDPVATPALWPDKVRFLWEVTAEGLITSVSREALDVFGSELGRDMIGRHWSALCGALVHDPSGSVQAAFEAGRTWSGRSTLWRIPGSDRAYPVTLAGLPLSDARQVKGWRGFGVIDTRTTEPFPLPIPDGTPDLALPAEAAEADLELNAPQRSEPASEPGPAEPREDDSAAAVAAVPSSEPAAVAMPAALVTNIVPIRPHDPPPRLSRTERNAFREIAKALGARIEGDQPQSTEQPSVTAAPPHETVPAQRPDMDAPALPASGSGLVDRVVQVAPPAPPRSDMYVALLDKLPIGVLVLRAGTISYANRTLLDLLDIASLDDLKTYGADRLFGGAAPSEGGGFFTLTRPIGEPEPVDARLSAIMWHGEPATLMSFRRALDQGNVARIEALKLELARATEKARELTAILDTATDGVATFDERGRILSLNRSAEALFGYDQREVAGENFTLLLAPESHITALDYLDGLKGGGVASLLNDGREVQGRVRQGGRIPLFMTMGCVADGDETIYSAVLRDMTAWKRAEADLLEAKRHAERASAHKSDVLAKISHEIRTPLNAILGFAEVMSEERFGPIGNERYKEYLGDIHQSGGYLISLINDLLDLAKIEAGKMDLNFTGVSLNEIASAAVSLLQPEANRQRVVLRTGLQPRLPAVVADDRSLRQIVINLLSNAVKFTDAGGQVIISTTLGDRGEVILRVRDTGVGMTDKELALAMEPFRQVSSTRRGTGTGLGLPITKALVEANKGQLAITSAKNEGTLAEITFPPQRVLAS
jgi:PAS domain S-box-containing protein